MKINLPRHRLILMLAPPIILVGFLIFWFFPSVIYFMAQLHWLFILLCLVLIISPWGNKKLGEGEGQSVLGVLARIWVWQICLFIIFLGIVSLDNSSTSNLDLSNSLKSLLISQGLFPWGAVGVFAVAFGLTSFVRKEEGFVSALVFPFFKAAPQDRGGLIVNFIARLSTILALAVCALLCMMFLVILMSAWIRAPLEMGLFPGIILTTFLILFLSFTSWFKKILKWIFAESKALAVKFFTLIFILSLMVVVLNSVFHSMNLSSLTSPTFFEALKSKPLSSFIFAFSFWLAWVPVSAIYIAKLGRGYSARMLILYSLVLPSLFATLFYFGSIPTTLLYKNSILILAVLSFLVLLHLLFERNFIPSLVLSYLPKEGRYKHRDYYFFLRNQFKVVALMLYGYLPIGISALSLMMFVFIFPLGVLSVFVLISLLLRLRND